MEGPWRGHNQELHALSANRLDWLQSLQRAHHLKVFKRLKSRYLVTAVTLELLEYTWPSRRSPVQKKGIRLSIYCQVKVCSYITHPRTKHLHLSRLLNHWWRTEIRLRGLPLYSDGDFASLRVEGVEPALHEKSPLQAEGGDQEVESHTTEAVAFQEGHEETKSNKDHDMDVLEAWREGNTQWMSVELQSNDLHLKNYEYNIVKCTSLLNSTLHIASY